MSKEIETFRIICEDYIKHINRYENKRIPLDYFYNPIYEVELKRTGFMIFHIETALKRLEQDQDKLKQYKDIEEELGIDLITLFKALKNGIYDKNEDRNVLVFLSWHYHLKEMVLFYDDENPYYNGCYQFKDYGKTWALTKEELL